MQHKGNPLYRINDFFEEYAQAVERQDSKYITNCFAMPCSFISDDSSQVYTTEVKLEGLVNQGKRFYAVHGIVHAIPDIKNKRSITERLVRVSLNWKYTDKKGKTVYDCDYYYILKLDENDEWKIEVAIPVNEKEQIDVLDSKDSNRMNINTLSSTT